MIGFLLGNGVVRVAAAILGLALLLGAGSLLFRGPPDMVAPSSDAISASNISFAQSSSDTGIDFVARPLFWADRRPLAPVAAPVVTSAGAGEPAKTSSAGVLEKVKLRGTFASGDEAGAIVNYGGERYRLVVGDSLEGWSLVDINEDGAVFEGQVYAGRPAERSTVALEHAYPKGGGAPVASRDIEKAQVVSAGERQKQLDNNTTVTRKNTTQEGER